MKVYIFITKIIFIIFSVLLIAEPLGAQGIDYNNKVDDEALSKKEAEAQKNAAPGTADPYYDKYLKNEYEKKQEEKADKLIEELKKDYGTDVFNKETLEKGPNEKGEKKGSQPSGVSSDDPYYEEKIKGSWEAEHKENKEEVVEWLKKEIEGEEAKQKEKASEGASDEFGPPPSDPYYNKKIKKSWSKDKRDLLERVRKKLKEEKMYKTVEEEAKEKEKSKKKGK